MQRCTNSLLFVSTRATVRLSIKIRVQGQGYVISIEVNVGGYDEKSKMASKVEKLLVKDKIMVIGHGQRLLSVVNVKVRMIGQNYMLISMVSVDG